MNDDEILTGLRDAARRRDATRTGTALDAPLDDAFVARMASRVAPPRNRRRLWIALPTVGMAAAVLLWLTVSHSPPSLPLPTYSVELHGGIDDVRGGPALAPSALSRSVTVHAGASLELLLRPAEDVTGKVEAHPFVVNDGTAREIPSTSRVSPTGAIDLHLDVYDAAGAAREVTLIVVIARGDGPIEPAAIAEGRASAASGTQVEHVAIHVAE